MVVADAGADQDATAGQPLDQAPVDRHAVVDDQRVGAPPVVVGDPVRHHLATNHDLDAFPEHLALDLGVVFELRIGHEDQHGAASGRR